MPAITSKSYYSLYIKQILDLLFAFLCLLFFSPFFLFISILIKLDSKGPMIFKQKRVGKNGKIFIIYKFRTMVKEAEKLKEKYRHLNEADGPVFKIKNDPRFTKFGKLLARSGLDELPQLINVLRGEMSVVGPRPLPKDEAQKINHKIRKIRESVLPGITSIWIVNGKHKLGFDRWMKSDQDYVENVNFCRDLSVMAKTVHVIVSATLNADK